MKKKAKAKKKQDDRRTGMHGAVADGDGDFVTDVILFYSSPRTERKKEQENKDRSEFAGAFRVRERAVPSPRIAHHLSSLPSLKYVADTSNASLALSR
jgi:hypothetical protein